MRPERCQDGPPWRRRDDRRPAHTVVLVKAHARARFFRRLVIGLVSLVVMAGLGLAATGWLLAERVGLGGPTGVGLAALALLAGTFVFVAGLVIVRGGAGPLRAVMDAADRVADGDYTVRVREHGPPPVRALAHAFNAMTERLAHADRLRRDLMADVAHELRTPLSVLQGRIEGLIDGVYPRDDRQLAALLEETHVLSRLIEDLRTLALADAGALRLEPEATDIVALVRDVVEGFAPDAARQGARVAVAAALAEVELDVDPLRLRQVLTNLVSNAVRHTPAGQAITVSIDVADAIISIASTRATPRAAPGSA